MSEESGRDWAEELSFYEERIPAFTVVAESTLPTISSTSENRNKWA